MSFIASSWPSGAHDTDFFFLRFRAFRLVRFKLSATDAVELADWGGGVDTAGDSFRATFIDLSASLKGSKFDGCATASSFFVDNGTGGAFLKEGNFCFDFGAEKKDESALASFTDAAAVTGLTSFFTGAGFVDVAVPKAAFF